MIDSVLIPQFYTNNTGVKVRWGIVFSMLLRDNRVNPISTALRAIFKRGDVMVVHWLAGQEEQGEGSEAVGALEGQG